MSSGANLVILDIDYDKHMIWGNCQEETVAGKEGEEPKKYFRNNLAVFVADPTKAENEEFYTNLMKEMSPGVDPKDYTLVWK